VHQLRSSLFSEAVSRRQNDTPELCSLCQRTPALAGLMSAAGPFVCLGTDAQAVPTTLPPSVGKLHAAIDSDAARLVEIFKDIHANPELGFMETRTAAIIERELKANGFSVRLGIGKTGWSAF
jgi:hypothetical protein